MDDMKNQLSAKNTTLLYCNIIQNRIAVFSVPLQPIDQMASTKADKIIDFYRGLLSPPGLPRGVEVLYPFSDSVVQELMQQFFHKFYHDNRPRRLILGINPGRLGAGITGINFTAPRQLQENCGIDHPFKPSSELSAEFIYEVINAYGGVDPFFNDWFIGAVSPLGYIKEGKNINYYDDKKLQSAVIPFIVNSIQQQCLLAGTADCICIGEDKNYKFLSFLNEKYKWFDTISTVPHPRFVMQYRRKQKAEYIEQYLHALTKFGQE